MRISLQVPADNAIGPEFMENILGSVHQRMRQLPRRDRLTLAFGGTGEGIGLYAEFPKPLQPVLQGGLHGAYPTTTVEARSAETPPAASEMPTVTRSLRLTPDLYPLRRFRQFESDNADAPPLPLGALLQCLSTLPSGRIELTLRPVRRRRQQRALRSLCRLHHSSFLQRPRLRRWVTTSVCSPARWRRALARTFMSLVTPTITPKDLASTETTVDREHRRESDLMAASEKLAGQHLFAAELTLSAGVGADGDRRAAEAALDTLEAALAPYVRQRNVAWRRVSSRQARRGFLLSSEEIATLWHPPLGNVQSEQLNQAEFTALEPPQRLPDTAEEGITVLGEVCFRGRQTLVGMRPRDRARHLHIIGKTGTGKSTLLFNLIQSDLLQGRGVALVDPHGDLADSVIASVPRHRTRDVVVIDPADTAHPVALNLVDCPKRRLRPLVASGVVSAFKKLNDSWGPRLEDLLRNAALACLEREGTTLLSLLQLLTDERYRSALIRDLRDPICRAYWHEEFAGFSRQQRGEAIAAVTNKVRPFLAVEPIRHIVGQSHGKVRLREIMDSGRILVVKLSKGSIGEDMSNLFGALLLTKLQIDAFSRSDLSEPERQPFYVYVDEFQNFATDSFSTMLSEARKYGLALTLSHQYIEQLGDERAAVFGNVDNLLCFRTGASDAEAMSEEFAGLVPPTDLTRLPAHTAYLRVLIDGQPTRPFTIRTRPPSARTDQSRARSVRNYSVNRYARPLSRVRREVTLACA